MSDRMAFKELLYFLGFGMEVLLRGGTYIIK